MSDHTTRPNESVKYLTKREQFAAMAMKSLILKPNIIDLAKQWAGDASKVTNEELATYVGKLSCIYADKLIEALNEETDKI